MQPVPGQPSFTHAVVKFRLQKTTTGATTFFLGRVGRYFISQAGIISHPGSLLFLPARCEKKQSWLFGITC